MGGHRPGLEDWVCFEIEGVRQCARRWLVRAVAGHAFAVLIDLFQADNEAWPRDLEFAAAPAEDAVLRGV